MRRIRPLRLLATSLLVSSVSLVSLLVIARFSIASQPLGNVRFVAQGGIDDGNLCTDSNLPCASVQRGIDVADSGDEVRIAVGAYTGVHGRAAPPGYEGPAVITQVVYLTKTLMLRGGFTTTDWTVPNPERFPTVVDARNQGRGLFMAGPISPTIDGVWFVNGNATGLGGGVFSYDGGGNVAVYRSAPTVRHSRFVSGTARLGGGFWLGQGRSVLDANYFLNNTATQGGGFFAGGSSATLNDNLFAGNMARSTGGGLLLLYSDMTLINNAVVGNRTEGDASGIGVGGSTATFLHTTVADNTGGDGSGVTINELLSVPSQTSMTNTILVNQTAGITVGVSSQVQMNGVLWFANGVNTGGLGAITITTQYTGNPAFAEDGYHLSFASAAIDRGVDAGVQDDIDGDLRPVGGASDLGADEYPYHSLLLPLLPR
jgi:hypothetical protein